MKDIDAEIKKTDAEIKKWKTSCMDKYYRQLQGYVIEKFAGIAEDEDDFGGEGFPTFILRHPSGERLQIEVSCDSEGNGGGFLFIGAPEGNTK